MEVRSESDYIGNIESIYREKKIRYALSNENGLYKCGMKPKDCVRQ